MGDSVRSYVSKPLQTFIKGSAGYVLPESDIKLKSQSRSIFRILELVNVQPDIEVEPVGCI